jgi:hypothetical protein
MNDIDARLSQLLAGQGPAADFDARLAVRLEAERQREARLDRRAALDLALREYAFLREAQSRTRLRSLIAVLAVGAMALLTVLLTSGLWQGAGAQLALQLHAAGDGVSAGTPAGMAWFVLLAALIVFASVRPQWLRRLWESTFG